MLSSINSFVNNATNIWSGAVDVIAIKQKDGSIRCSPFYVQVGKLKLLRPGEKVIRIMVNGKLTDLEMRIGSNGEAYFAQEVGDDEEVGEDEIVSPLGSPLSPLSDIHDGKGQNSSPDEALSGKHSGNSQNRKSLIEEDIKTTEHTEIIYSPTVKENSGNKLKPTWSNWVSTFFTKDEKGKEPHIVKDDFVEAQLMESLKSEYDYEVQSRLFPKKPTIEDDEEMQFEMDFDDLADVCDPVEIESRDIQMQESPPKHTPPFQETHYSLPVSSPRDSPTSKSSSILSNSPKKTFALNIPKGKSGITESPLDSPVMDEEMIYQLTPSLPPHMISNNPHQKFSSNSLPRNFGGTDLPKAQSSSFQLSVKDTHSVNPSKWSSWWSGSYSYNSPVNSPLQESLKKSSRPTSFQLKRFGLKLGKNSLKFIVQGRVLGTQTITAQLYLWNYDDKIVISDVDGTITRSDAFGHILPRFNIDWSHAGVAHLYNAIEKNGYKLMYLTARSIVQSHTTKDYLENLTQGKVTIPPGPCIMSSDRLFHCLKREVILRKPEEFKIATLMDIKNLFPESTNPFYAGFGNRLTDKVSYEAVGIPTSRIYIVNSTGKITVVDNVKHHHGYIDILKTVDLIFPHTDSQKNRDSSNSYWNIGTPALEDFKICLDDI